MESDVETGTGLKHAVIEFDDQTLDRVNMRQMMKSGKLKLTPNDADWDLIAYFSKTGWAKGRILATADTSKDIAFVYKRIKKDLEKCASKVDTPKPPTKSE